MIGQAVLVVLIGYKLFKYNKNEFEIYNKTVTVTDHPSPTQCLTKQVRNGDLHKCKNFHQLKLKDLQK